MSRDFFRYCVSHGQKTEENEAETQENTQENIKEGEE